MSEAVVNSRTRSVPSSSAAYCHMLVLCTLEIVHATLVKFQIHVPLSFTANVLTVITNICAP